jgi:ketosteroid isomerase-like protein
VDEILAFWELFNAGRLEEAIALCSPDFEYVDHQNGGVFDAHGFLGEMRKILEAAPDRRVTILRKFADGTGSGVLEAEWRGTFTGAPEPVITGVAAVVDTADGLITQLRMYYG